MDRGRPVLVVGAGFSGLAAAHHLSRAGFQVEVREATARVGGLISTRQTAHGLVETAANGLLNSSWVEDLFAAGGVEMISMRKEARARYIVRAGRARRWPLGVRETVAIACFIARYVFARGTVAPRSGETVAAWGERVLSPSASHYTIETALQGIYAGDPRQMSARLIFGRFFDPKEAAVESVAPLPHAGPLRFRGSVAPRGGMGELTNGLWRRLEARGVRFQFEQPFDANDLKRADCPVVLASGLAAAAGQLQLVDPERSRALAALEILPVITATVYFPKGSSNLRGFGCLFPPGEGHRVLGMLMNNWIFADRSRECLAETWIIGGASLLHSSSESLSDGEILSRIRAERQALLGHDTEPLDAVITRWPRALPHFTVAMEDAAARFRPDRCNVFLLGNFTGGIGLAKILEQASRLPQRIANEGKWRQ